LLVHIFHAKWREFLAFASICPAISIHRLVEIDRSYLPLVWVKNYGYYVSLSIYLLFIVQHIQGEVYCIVLEVHF